MLSNQLQNGIDRAKIMWSRLPNAEENEDDHVSFLKKTDGGGVESLDYEVIENYAYWDEQVLPFCFVFWSKSFNFKVEPEFMLEK